MGYTPKRKTNNSLLLLRVDDCLLSVLILLDLAGEREMENVHLAVEEDDLYSGYNDYNPTFDSDVSYKLY